MDTIVVSIDKCARCGSKHKLTFKHFKNDGIDGYEYWATCPNTNDPILLKRIAENQEEENGQ